MNIALAKDVCGRIAELIDSAVNYTLGLQDILEQELHALRTQDRPGLEQAMTEKSNRVEKLRQIDAERSNLCAAQGIEPGADQMSKLIDVCGDDSAIAQSWDRLMQLAFDCNALNMKIGAIIRLRQQQIDDGIAFLRGDTTPNATYQVSGESPRAGTMRSIAEA